MANPHACLWGGEEPVLISAGLTPVASDRIPLLFVHGMEYHRRGEILRDLIKPFEAEARLCKGQDHSRFDYYFVHWDSRIDGKTSLPFFPFNAFCGSVARLGMGALQLGRKLSCLEERARSAAKELKNLVRPLFKSALHSGPVVVTHSLGAMVWSETLRELLQDGFSLHAPGTWWNLQPAIAADAFTAKGAYPFVLDLYSQKSARLEVWHSRLDIVLATLFFGAKRTLAMGQIGMRSSVSRHLVPDSTLDLDLTTTVREAHGQTFLMKNAGPFFRRAGQQLHFRAKNL